MSSPKLLTVLAICDQIATIFLGIAVIRWYAHVTEDPRLFPSSPFTDPYASFCLALALCARPLIVLSMSFLELLEILFHYEPNLGTARWRLHVTIMLGAGSIAGLTTFFSTQKIAPCLFLLAALLTLCVCATIILAISLAVIRGYIRQKRLQKRVDKPRNNKPSFVVHGVTAVASAMQDSSLQQPGFPLRSDLTTSPANGNMPRLDCHQQHNSTQVVVAVSRPVPDFTSAARGHRPSTSLHHRKPSKSQTVARVYGDTYFKDETTKAGEWKSTHAERHYLDLSPPESPGAHIPHPTDDGASTDHFEFSTPRDMSLDEARSPTSQYSQVSATARKVRPLSTLSIFSEMTAESQLEEGTHPTAGSLCLAEDPGFLENVFPLSQGNTTSQTTQVSFERRNGAARAQATTQISPGQHQSRLPGRYTEDLSLNGEPDGAHWRDQMVEESHPRVFSVAVTLDIVGFLVVMWIEMALSMPYLLHPINLGSEEEVTSLLPLLLVVGIVVAGPLHLLQVVLTGNKALLISREDARNLGASTSTTFRARSPPGGDGGSSDGVPSPSVPGAYHSDHYTNPSRGAQACQDASQHTAGHGPSRFSSSYCESSRIDLSVASVPYSSKHWRAGKVSGDEVLRSRGAFRRAANLLEPRPKLDVLPARSKQRNLARRTKLASRRHARRIMRTLTPPERSRKSKAITAHIAQWNDDLSEPVISYDSSHSFGSPGAGRNCSAHDTGVTLFQNSHAQRLTRDLDLDLDIADCVKEVNLSSFEHFCEDSFLSLTRPQDAPKKVVLDSLSAMLLPHIAPGIIIGHDIEVTQDAEKEFMEELDYQLRLEQSGEYFSLSEDRSTLSKVTSSKSNSPMQSSLKPAKSRILPLRPFLLAAVSDRESSRGKRNESGLDQDVQALPLNLPPSSAHSHESARMADDQPQKDPRTVPGLGEKSPSHQLSSRFAMLEPRISPKTTGNDRLHRDRLNDAVATAEGSSFSKSKSCATPRTKSSKKLRSSLSRRWAQTSSLALFPTEQLSGPFRAYEQTPGKGPLPYKRIVSDAERMGISLPALPRSDGQIHSVEPARSDQECSSIKKLRTSPSRGLAQPSLSTPFQTEQLSSPFKTYEQTSGKQSFPDKRTMSDEQRLSAHVADSPQHTTQSSYGSTPAAAKASLTGLIHPLSASTPPSNLCSVSHERGKTWDRLPEPIATPHERDDSVAREEADSPCKVLPFLPITRHPLSPDDMKHDCNMDESLHSDQSTHEIEEKHSMPQGAEVSQELSQMQDQSEDSLTSPVKPLSPTFLAAFAQSALESAHTKCRSVLTMDTAEHVAVHLPASLRSPISKSVEEPRDSLDSSLLMDRDINNRHCTAFSPAAAGVGASELLYVSQSDSCRDSVSPSVNSSTAKRKSLVSEFGLSDGTESYDDRLSEQISLSNDIEPQILGQQTGNAVAKETPTADKRSTGGTITTTDSSFLSSELILSPVGSVTSQSSLSPGRTSAPDLLSQPPESPLRKLARRYDRSGAMELENTSKDSAASEPDSEQALNLRDLNTLDYHMYRNPVLNLRLPTLTEVSEEASQSTCGVSSEAHYSSRRDDSAWGMLDRILGDVYRKASDDCGDARGRTVDLSPSFSDRRAVRDVEAGHKVAVAAVQTISELRSPTGSVRSPGWLHVIDRQTSIMAVESRHSTIGKERNGSNCSRVTYTTSTPQRIIGLRSEFWSVQNQPLPPLPFDIVTAMANSSARHSVAADLAGDVTLSKDEPDELSWGSQSIIGESERLWTGHRPDSDVWSQASEAEFVAQLNERERLSAEHVRNTPQRSNHHRASQMSKEVKIERRKSSATLLKGRRSMSSLLGFSKTSSTWETRANTSLPEMARRGPCLETLKESLSGAKTASSQSSQSTQWLFVNNSAAASSTSFVVPDSLRETASETDMLVAELEKALRRDAKRLTSDESQQRRQIEATMTRHTAERALHTLMDPHAEKRIKRIPAGRLALHSILAQPGQSSGTTLAGDQIVQPIDRGQGNSIDSLPLGLCTVPADHTLQAISDSSVTASDLSRAASATSTRADLKTLFFSESPKKSSKLPLDPQHRNKVFSVASKIAAPSEWPASTPARAQHLSQLPEIEGAFRALMSLSPNVTETGSTEKKKRWPRLSDAHLVSSTVNSEAGFKRSSQSSISGQQDGTEWSPQRPNARPRGPRGLQTVHVVSGEMDENVNPF